MAETPQCSTGAAHITAWRAGQQSAEALFRGTGQMETIVAVARLASAASSA
jgi:hypothetical protein